MRGGGGWGGGGGGCVCKCVDGRGGGWGGRGGGRGGQDSLLLGSAHLHCHHRRSQPFWCVLCVCRTEEGRCVCGGGGGGWCLQVCG